MMWKALPERRESGFGLTDLVVAEVEASFELIQGASISDSSNSSQLSLLVARLNQTAYE